MGNMLTGHSPMDAMPAKRDVLDCLDRALSSRGRGPRIDTAGPLVAGVLVAKFEERAVKEVALRMLRVASAKRRPTYAFFCENDAYGALALHDKYDFVVLNIGVVSAILNFCGRMMANDGLWTNIGRAPESGGVAKALETGFPDDSARMALAIVFAGECFDFIVRHELAHLVLGHCQFLATIGQDTSIDDSDGRSGAGVDPMVVQTLELAADGHAAIWGFEKLRNIRERLGRRPSSIDEAYHQFDVTREEGMLNYLLSMFFVFRLMDETAWDTSTLASRCHPPAPVRFHVACIHLEEYFKTSGNTASEEQLLRAMQKVWTLGEEIFAQALSRTPDSSVLHRTMSEESERHYNLLSERARTLPQTLFSLA
jgi:hypothetical protein